MSLASFERDILRRLSEKLGKKVRSKDLMEWSTTPVIAQAGETLVEISDPDLHVYCAVKLADGKA